ncbi:Uncharacterised protein [uncultured archaeon]|nr:Uncharacterised protein [uncultured archaeon]
MAADRTKPPAGPLKPPEVVLPEPKNEPTIGEIMATGTPAQKEAATKALRDLWGVLNAAVKPFSETPIGVLMDNDRRLTELEFMTDPSLRIEWYKEHDPSIRAEKIDLIPNPQVGIKVGDLRAADARMVSVYTNPASLYPTVTFEDYRFVTTSPAVLRAVEGAVTQLAAHGCEDTLYDDIRTFRFMRITDDLSRPTSEDEGFILWTHVPWRGRIPGLGEPPKESQEPVYGAVFYCKPDGEISSMERMWRPSGTRLTPQFDGHLFVVPPLDQDRPEQYYYRTLTFGEPQLDPTSHEFVERLEEINRHVIAGTAIYLGDMQNGGYDKVRIYSIPKEEASASGAPLLSVQAGARKMFGLVVTEEDEREVYAIYPITGEPCLQAAIGDTKFGVYCAPKYTGVVPLPTTWDLIKETSAQVDVPEEEIRTAVENIVSRDQKVVNGAITPPEREDVMFRLIQGSPKTVCATVRLKKEIEGRLPELQTELQALTAKGADATAGEMIKRRVLSSILEITETHPYSGLFRAAEAMVAKELSTHRSDCLGCGFDNFRRLMEQMEEREDIPYGVDRLMAEVQRGYLSVTADLIAESRMTRALSAAEHGATRAAVAHEGALTRQEIIAAEQRLEQQIVDVSCLGATKADIKNLNNDMRLMVSAVERIDPAKQEEHFTAIQRALKEIQEQPDLPEEIRKAVAESLHEGDGRLSTEAKLKTTIPIIPLILSMEVSTKIPWKEGLRRIKESVGKAFKDFFTDLDQMDPQMASLLTYYETYQRF